MLILAICSPAEGADLAEFGGLVPAETAALRALKSEGVLTKAWSPGRPGAVLMLDIADEAQAAQLMAGLPLAKAGLIRVELIPLRPLDL